MKRLYGAWRDWKVGKPLWKQCASNGLFYGGVMWLTSLVITLGASFSLRGLLGFGVILGVVFGLAQYLWVLSNAKAWDQDDSAR